MRQNVAIVFSLFLVLLLGLWGQYVLSPTQFTAQFLTRVYEVIMLFALGGDWTTSLNLPWQLELARILAPAVSVAGVLIILTRGAWVGLTNLFIRFWSDHVVVVGLGEKGRQFAESCADVHKTVIVERDGDNPLIERVRNHGISVIVGDILDEQVMTAANLRRARHMVTFCGNDGTSVEIAMRAREYLSRPGAGEGPRLRIHLHVNATRVSSRLESYAKFYDAHRVAEVDFFSVYELSARLLLKKYPPDGFADVFGQRQVHIALYGFGHLAEQILTEAVRICHFLNGRQVRFSIFEPGAGEKIRNLLSLHPGIAQLSEIDGVDVPEMHALSLDALSDEFLASITEHVICLQNDEENLELALSLRDALLGRPGCNAPINVRMQHSSGLARLLESRPGEPEIPDGLYPFGMLDEVLFYDNILSDRLDELAQALHEDYLQRRSNVDSDQRLYSALNEWRGLPQPARKSSRLQADHLAAKLRAVRCHHSEDSPVGFAFTDDEAEALARMEHDRWRANMIFEGWREGAERIEGARINPFAIPWESMDLKERQDEINAIKRLPQILHARLGWQVRREFYVGVTGHRPHRLNTSDENLLRAIDNTLGEIARTHSDKRLILVSPLAEGADRMVARLAMDRHGMALHVPLPLPFELYQSDFASDTSLNEFKELVGRAERYFELPAIFGTVESLARHIDGSPNENRDRQYGLAGAYIVETCDEVIAVFDGGEAMGIGGTAQVIKWRIDGKPPPEFHNNSDFVFRPPMSPPIIVKVGAD